MAQIKIRIGAERDRSVDATFGSIERRAARSAVLIQKMLNKGLTEGLKGGNARMPGPGGMGGGAVRARISAEEKERLTAVKREDSEKVRLLKHRYRLERQEQSFNHREGLRQIRQQEAEKLAGLRRARREAEKAAHTAQRTRRQFAERTSHRATRFLTPNAPIGSMATRALGDFARGAGVDFSIAGSVARAVGLEQQAQAIANSGYLAGDKDAKGNPTANATRVSASELVAQARSVAGEYGLEASTALDALDGFATIAGDLALGRRLLGDMAKLSAATGTELGDMAAAAANVANQLDGVENKEEVINRVMKTIAGQGKLGAVEVADLSTHMARVAAASSKFAGDRAVNIQKMGALAQLARSKGGAPSAAEAARSVANLSTMFTKTARIDAFEKASGGGVKVYTDATKTKVRDPLAIIEDSLMATGGNLQKLNKMYQDTVAFRAVAGAASIFNDAGGGEAGRAKVRAELSRLLEGADLKDDEIDESARLARETDAAKAAQFQNKLDTIVTKVSKDLIPALEKVAPQLLNFAEMLGHVAKWSVENPVHASALATAAVTMRAGLESAFRSAVEKAILGARTATAVSTAADGTVVAAGGGSGGSKLAKGALGVTAVLAGAEVGYALGAALAPTFWDGFFERDAGAQGKEVQDQLAFSDKLAELERSFSRSRPGSSERQVTEEEARSGREMLVRRIGRAEVRNSNSSFHNLLNDVMNGAFGDGVGTSSNPAHNAAQEKVDAQNLGQLREQLAKLDRLLSGTINVRVTNQPAAPVMGQQAPPMPGD